MADDDVVPPKNFGFPDGNIPSAEDLLAAVEKIAGLSEENKEELRKSILRGAAGKMAEDFVPPAAAEGGGTGTEMLILLGLISLVFSVILFVGYKLYISLIVRNREREEKRRQKQLKKKK